MSPASLFAPRTGAEGCARLVDGERREDLKRLFEQASGLPADEQAAFLDEACADDPELRSELASLLKAADSADPLFEELEDAVPLLDEEPTWTIASDPELDALVGQTVRQYRIDERLGSGGMGVVYRAHDTALDRDVALKFLPRHVVADEVATERFVLEARSAAALDHPNVCTVHEIGRDEEDRPFIAMAYCDGETLKQKLARGPLPVEEAADIATQIATGLNAAHVQGIVHRDIKPGNVIVTPDGVAKILDFGLAKLADVTLTGTGVTLGTAAYMSPEQTRGEELDARTDLWSLGVVLYEMLTGERPFKGDRQLAVIHAIRHEEPRPPSELRDEIPAEVEKLVLGLLCKEPEDRTESARTLVGDLAPLVAKQRPAPARRRHMVRGVAGALVLAAIGAGAAAAVLAGLRSRADVPLDPDRVVVAVLENQTGEPALDRLGRQAAERITQGIQQREVAHVVPTEVALAATPAREERGGMDAVAALARASGAGVVLHGAYYLLGDSLHFQIQITDVAQGEVMSAMAPVSAPRAQVGEALSRLEDRTLGALAAALDFRDGELWFPTQPPSLKAYRLYQEGWDAFDRYDADEAYGYFQQALALDSTWVSALHMAALTVIDADPAAGDSLLRISDGYLEQMSEMDNLMIQGLRSHAVDEDPAVKLRRNRRLAELAPGGLRWGYFVAWQAYRPREALGYIARMDTTTPRYRRIRAEVWSMTARMHQMLGNHEQELEVTREWRRRLPDDVGAVQSYLFALAALGRIGEIEAMMDTALARTGNPYPVTNAVASVLRAHGFDDAARRVAQRALDWLETRPPDEVEEERFHYTYMRAEFLYLLERWQEALDLFEQLVEEYGEQPQFPVDILASTAGAAARLGDVERARTLDAELADRIVEVRAAGWDYERVMEARLLAQRARIAAVLGEREQAVRFLEEGFRITRHKGYFVRNERHGFDLPWLLNDYLPFQEFVKPRG